MGLEKFVGLPNGANNFSKEGYKANSKDKNNPYNIIGSGNITMKNVPHPVYGIDDLGNEQMMMPGGEYQFPGSHVIEFPVPEMRYGGVPQYAPGGPIEEEVIQPTLQDPKEAIANQTFDSSGAYDYVQGEKAKYTKDMFTGKTDDEIGALRAKMSQQSFNNPGTRDQGSDDVNQVVMSQWNDKEFYDAANTLGGMNWQQKEYDDGTSGWSNAPIQQQSSNPAATSSFKPQTRYVEPTKDRSGFYEGKMTGDNDNWKAISQNRYFKKYDKNFDQKTYDADPAAYNKQFNTGQSELQNQYNNAQPIAPVPQEGPALAMQQMGGQFHGRDIVHDEELGYGISARPKMEGPTTLPLPRGMRPTFEPTREDSAAIYNAGEDAALTNLSSYKSYKPYEEPKRKQEPDVKKMTPRSLRVSDDRRGIDTTPRKGVPKLPMSTIIGYNQSWNPTLKKWEQEPEYQAIAEPGMYQQGGAVEEMELTDQEIAQMRAQGYRIDVL